MRALFIGLILLALGVVAGYFLGGRTGMFAKPASTKEIQGTPKVVQKDPLQATSDDLLGLWRSDEERQVIREFKKDGSVVDTFAGGGESTTQEGEWSIFVGPGREPASVPLTKGVTYLKIVWPEEVSFLAIRDLTSGKLTLEYAGGGGKISFTKVR